jgi:hypothetical protein
MKIETKKLSNGGVLTLVKTNSISFKKGDVVLVTDPCYWFDEEGAGLWSEFCDMMFPSDWTELPKEDKLYTYCFVKYKHPNGDETEFLMTSTEHGDGGYDVNCDYRCTKEISGGGISVDAGCYAVTLLSSAKRFDKFDKSLESEHGTVLEFLMDGIVYVDGANMSGAIECVTDDSNEGEEETCDYCDETINWCCCEEFS